MACYRNGGCGPYEMTPCSECPASRPDYNKQCPFYFVFARPRAYGWDLYYRDYEIKLFNPDFMPLARPMQEDYRPNEWCAQTRKGDKLRDFAILAKDGDEAIALVKTIIDEQEEAEDK